MKKEVSISLFILIFVSLIFIVFIIIIQENIFNLTGGVVEAPSNRTKEAYEHLWLGSNTINGLIPSPDGSIYFVGVGNLFGVYNKTANNTEDLSTTDTGDWIGGLGYYNLMGDLIYDSTRSVVYIGGSFIRGDYNRSTNTTTNLMAVNPENWLTEKIVFGITYDSSRDLFYFAGFLGFAAMYNRTANSSENLSGTGADDNWFITQNLADIVYNPNNTLVYFVGTGGAFEVYNRSTNQSLNLNGTDAANWISTNSIQAVAHDATHNLIYLAGNNGVFGVYNVSDNITYDLRAADVGNWIGTTQFHDITYDSTNDLVYFVGGDTTNGELFGYYNRSNNTAGDLTPTDIDDWIGTLVIQGVTYDVVNNLVYVGGAGGIFGYYNKSTNITYDLNFPNDWVRSNDIEELTYDTASGLVYLGGSLGIFGYYNRTSNSKTDLRATEADEDWMSNKIISALAYDSNNDSIFIGGGTIITLSDFGFYDKAAGTSKNLNTTDTSNWMGNKSISAMVYDSNNERIYLGSSNGAFGYYNTSENITYSLNGTDISSWFPSNGVTDLTFDSNNSLIYFIGSLGIFGVYNISDNKTYDLRAADAGDWIGTGSGTTLFGLTYDSSRGLLYIGGGAIFGAYNLSSGAVEDLRTADADNWITTNINDLTYSSADGLIYFAGERGLFGVYNKTNGTSENLNMTDAYDWISNTTINSLTYDSNNSLVYLGGDSGLIAYYNRTANTTSVVSSPSVTGGGGSRTTVTEEETSTTSTETISIPIAPGGGSASIPITNPDIDLRNVVISPKTTITDAVLTVTSIKDNIADTLKGILEGVSGTEDAQGEISNIAIEFPFGRLYRAFAITTKAIENDNLNNVTLEFRVSKAELEIQNRTHNDVTIYRQPSPNELWQSLQTISISEDSLYYYYTVLSPGFSVFIILIHETKVECNPSQKRCFNNNVELCVGNSTWIITETCEKGCLNSECTKRFSIKGFFEGDNAFVIIFMSVMIAISGIIIIAYFTFKNFRKKIERIRREM